LQHSFGVPRFFFRFNMTSAISQQPYGYVYWSMFKLVSAIDHRLKEQWRGMSGRLVPLSDLV
jgi:hypothetical protein